MKSILLILTLFLLIAIPSKGQNISNLDTKYGINKFKLESPFSSYSKDLTFILKGKDGANYYKYTKQDISLFASEAKINWNEGIGLGFYNNKLYTISIPFYTLNDEEYYLIKSKLEELFGNGQGTRYTTGKYVERVKWETTNTYLGLDYYAVDSNHLFMTEVFMLSKKTKDQISSDGF